MTIDSGDLHHPQTHAAGEIGRTLSPSRPDSACISICSTLFNKVSQGCGRTATEVSNWVFYSEGRSRLFGNG